MGKIISLAAHRQRRNTKASNALNDVFNRSMLLAATALVRKHFPEVKLSDAWTYHFHEEHWEFHGPDDFCWHGSADGAYDARYHGWMAWLEKQGIALEAN
ncbi:MULTISPECIES: hypothetical protein [Paraburkholderia]|uniref:Uncharacterized protein n=1 Tax=Paraburkholderia madseniana TaxID=2599607 RepID=A0AAP5EU46_9BURK|nr:MULTISPECIES: hypothetical protein [Paraburkholderia]MCX4152003.1 hypothetical protein [Paraburkholderia madseniana]MCX4176915.1 hypothetical protein [Paraburkholderia madseniana]MDN7154931.1 hypothetical protein [Paraburkholderia sp. WS6]MDQ6413814.1 hypothetical protein [Paraburkholderia madseniana]MDQ6464906.1 hypothetical protein [Paraburkholderia madseniana]